MIKFIPIPGYENYGVSECGKIINFKKGRIHEVKTGVYLTFWVNQKKEIKNT